MLPLPATVALLPQLHLEDVVMSLGNRAGVRAAAATCSSSGGEGEGIDAAETPESPVCRVLASLTATARSMLLQRSRVPSTLLGSP